MVKKFIYGGLRTGPWDEFRVLGLQDTPEKIFGTFYGVRGYAPPENFENGASQIG